MVVRIWALGSLGDAGSSIAGMAVTGRAQEVGIEGVEAAGLGLGGLGFMTGYLVVQVSAAEVPYRDRILRSKGRRENVIKICL